MEAWKRRLTVLVAALGAAGMLMSSAEAREPRQRDGATPPTLSPDSSFPTFPTFPTTTPPPTMPPPTTSTTTPPPTMPPPTTTPPPTMPPNTLPPRVDDQIGDIIDTLEDFGDAFQDLIDFLSNPFAV